MGKLTFLGAAGEVTGSRYLLETDRTRVLLECGLWQGGRDADRRNRASLRRLAAKLDAVVVSHGHLDHAGLLPKLVRDGFRGPIHCTRGTAALLEIMLRDAAFVMARDVEGENRRRERAGRRLLAPLYTIDDVERTLELCAPLRYGETQRIAPGLELVFHDAGHILGSAIVDLGVESEGRRRRLVFSGDLGNDESVLMRSPTRVEHADLVLLESTYGDRNHRTEDDTLEELAGILADADRQGGNVLVPAFAVGRTQEMLYHLGLLHHAGRLPQRHVFLDSPMAIEVTRLYDRLSHLLDPADLESLRAAGGPTLAEALPQLELTADVEASRAINDVRGGAIIVAGSGMCTGGRIRHHLKHNLWRPETHLVIVGFQARGSLGRLLVDGVEKVKLFGEPIAVKGHVHTLGGFSAHAGQRQLLAWAAAFRDRPAVYLVHGEAEAREALAAALHEAHAIDTKRPQPHDAVVF